ncbi:MAG: 1-deoxy-D-xylulose-5-phosphate reductoisomerase [Vicinamibacteria bacterium]|nr:1-deoxy-D-xylulose-5-phosphate reductoisomerase [Vicinamibacteria bacterium]
MHETPDRRAVSVLGSTGSVGVNVLKVVEAFPDRFEIVGLAAGRNVHVLARQIARHRPRAISVADAGCLEELGRLVDLAGIQVGLGTDGMVAVATVPAARIVVASAVGAVGLLPTYRALQAGKDVALANKETLVMAGALMRAAAAATGARLLPIDSEHCALHQCLSGREPASVKRLLLTASGGPFRTWKGNLAEVRPADALKHPTWNMGRKISIDSATLMNKGLEVIEARWLFDVPGERIDVVVHPQSIVHSMVEFVDGTILAQLGPTDMRLPIQYALTYPEVWPSTIPGMDFGHALSLTFEPPDHERFPALGLARRALREEGTQPAALNAANEEAVAAFLADLVPFPAIAETVEAVMDAHAVTRPARIEDVLEADAWARVRARDELSRRPLPASRA